ncbi:unnamed protein product [Rhizoctonia solani]|uniref:DNA replication regulator SLD2 n=1 Tax=Rhizoctonia solani TaxID=456999 RepID=A0A8H3HSH8_9AGAM|nr:unnamed protein product [Rhizoctonia solani]
MSTDIAKIKVEIKEWQRAYRRTHGRDPGKDELRKNPEMQAKYKIWQDSIKGPSHKHNDQASTPPHPTKTLIPKAMPVQSTSKGPTTPFSARKKQAPRRSSSSSDERIPAPDLSSAKRTSSRAIPFNSASKSQAPTFPSILASDSDDDNPFAATDPVSPSRSRRASPNKPLQSPSKSTLFQTPSKPKLRSSSPETQPFLTPRTKARKRMRGEEVPATPGDKRRKLGAARSILSTQDEQDEDDQDDEDDEIIDSPKKKRATTVNGRVFTGLFDDDGMGGGNVEDASSVMDETSSFRSTPPPPPSEPDHDWTPTRSHSDQEDDDQPITRPKSRPVLPAIGKWTHDTWDTPAPGTDFSHLRKGLGKPQPDLTKQKPNKAKSKTEKQPNVLAVSNPFDLLPPMPDEEPAASTSKQYGTSRPKAKKGKEKEKEKAVEVDDGESSDGTGDMNVNEIEWKPFGPLIGSQTQTQRSDSQTPMSSQTQTQTSRPTLSEPDPTATLPSDLRTLLSLHSTRREFLRSDSLARDVLAGRSVPVRGGEVWGVGDMEDEEEGEGDDWDSEPEGWKGGVEM